MDVSEKWKKIKWIKISFVIWRELQAEIDKTLNANVNEECEEGWWDTCVRRLQKVERN